MFDKIRDLKDALTWKLENLRYALAERWRNIPGKSEGPTLFSKLRERVSVMPRRTKMIVAILSILLVSIPVAYALVSVSLQGTWPVGSKEGIEANKQSLSFTGSMIEEGDVVTETLKLTNTGNTDLNVNWEVPDLDTTHFVVTQQYNGTMWAQGSYALIPKNGFVNVDITITMIQLADPDDYSATFNYDAQKP
jgi:hypothetical protein